jgi:hypothetical protein
MINSARLDGCLPLPAILGAKAVRKMRDKRLPKKRELKEYVLRRARELAEDGKVLNSSCGFLRAFQKLGFGWSGLSEGNLMTFADTHGYESPCRQRRERNNAGR